MNWYSHPPSVAAFHLHGPGSSQLIPAAGGASNLSLHSPSLLLLCSSWWDLVGPVPHELGAPGTPQEQSASLSESKTLAGDRRVEAANSVHETLPL